MSAAVYERRFDDRQAALYNAAVMLVTARGVPVMEFIAERQGGFHMTLPFDDLRIDLIVMNVWDVSRHVGIEIAWRGAKLFHACHGVTMRDGAPLGCADVHAHVPGEWEDRLLKTAFAESEDRSHERLDDDGGPARDE